jgi:hypothetical protein
MQTREQCAQLIYQYQGVVEAPQLQQIQWYQLWVSRRSKETSKALRWASLLCRGGKCLYICSGTL